MAAETQENGSERLVVEERMNCQSFLSKVKGENSFLCPHYPSPPFQSNAFKIFLDFRIIHQQSTRKCRLFNESHRS